jgi:endonuclease/exonuclease/phosphatase family metal-dependent hydrolase
VLPSRRPIGPPLSARAAAVLVAVALAVGVLGVLGAVAPAGADEGTPATLAATRVVVVSHNVERRTSAIDDAVARARRTGATMVTLQEVCWWQARTVALEHLGWTVAWRRNASTPLCRPRSGLDLLLSPERGDIGTLVMVATPGAGVEWTQFRAQAPGKSRGLLCLTWRRGITAHLCSTHLQHPHNAPAKVVQQRQAAQVRSATAGWVDRGDLVILTGDFNAAPHTRVLDPIYATGGGSGRFHEATRCAPARQECRRGLRGTHDRARSKLDYVFFSANRMVTTRPHSVTLLPTRSDHHLLTAAAYVSTGPQVGGARR